MAQGSKPRHSRSTRKPVTIDLEPEAVSEDGKADKKPPSGTKASAGAKTASKSTPKVSGSAAKAKDATAAGEKNDAAVAAENVKTEAARAAKAMESTTAASSPGKSDKVAPGKPDTPAKKTASAGKAQPASGSSGGADKSADRPATGGGGLRTVSAGLVGGIVAIAVFAGLQWGGVLPAPGATGSQSGGLSEQIEALKQSVASLESEAGSGSAALGKALQERIDALEKTAELTTGGAVGSTLSALEAQVSALTTKIESIGETSQDGEASGLADKLTALQTSHTGQQSDLAKLQSSLTDLTNRIGADEEQQDQTLKGLDDRLASIETTLSSPREDIKVARALAAANLKAAIDRGGSFMAELEAFASVDGDSAAIGQLRSLAASGVPSRAKLLNEFPSVATDMINAAKGSGTETGWVDRLMNSASSLVQVRPVGEVSGDSVEAIVARMETKLSNGDLQGAVNEWKTLPESSQKVSDSFEKDLEARILVENLVSGTVNAALPTETTATGSTETKQTGGDN
ncbi:MAG: hypothetical protein GY933_00795 [Hyphomicrobiales bacterium]|nr:hypothetical protein [Hyphomicrobiales bacterium]